MKINKFTLLISVIMALLVSFFLSKYSLEQNTMVFGIGSFLSITLGIAGVISLGFDYDKTTVIAKVISGIFLILTLFIQIFFSINNGYDISTYVLITGVILMTYILLIFNISKTKM